MAALSRFLSKGAEKSLPFFKTLKSCKDKKTIRCSTNAEKAFQRMKELMEILLTLTAPIKGKVLIMYLVALTESISAVLLMEREKRQVPIYFISRVLQEAELNYSRLEKLILALVHAARRLRRYFQAHLIRVLIDEPIKQTLADPEKLGRIAKCAIELGEHDIEVKGRDSIKGQIPANFLVETPPTEDNKKEISKVGTKKEGENSKTCGNYIQTEPQALMAQALD
ncbi:reverse transcriptase domain-containing protein [Tanacetum coccineum]